MGTAVQWWPRRGRGGGSAAPRTLFLWLPICSQSFKIRLTEGMLVRNRKEVIVGYWPLRRPILVQKGWAQCR